MDNDINNAIIENIKKTIRDRAFREFSEYKNKCLMELDEELEAKRNDTIKAILDGIDVAILSQEPYSLEPLIQIKIEKKVIVNEK